MALLIRKYVAVTKEMCRENIYLMLARLLGTLEYLGEYFSGNKSDKVGVPGLKTGSFFYGKGRVQKFSKTGDSI